MPFSGFKIQNTSLLTKAFRLSEGFLDILFSKKPSPSQMLAPDNL